MTVLTRLAMSTGRQAVCSNNTQARERGRMKVVRKRTRGQEDKIVTEMSAEMREKKAESFRSSMRNKQKRLNDLGIDFEIAVPA